MLKDWIDDKGRLHRFLGIRLIRGRLRAFYRVEVPSTVLRFGPDWQSGGAAEGTYYSSTDDAGLLGWNNSYPTARTSGLAQSSLTNGIDIGQRYSSGTYYVYRAAFFFDTSGLADDAVISAATFGVYGDEDLSTTDFDLTLLAFTGSQPPEDEDYLDGFGATSFGSVSTSGFTVSGYNTITLNASGLAAISLTGTTALGLRSSRDISATAPSGEERVEVRSANTSGTGQDPKLTITYTATFPKTLTAYADVAGSLVRSVSRSLSASIDAVGDFLRKSGRHLSTTATATGSMIREEVLVVFKTLTASATATASLARQTGRNLVASIAAQAYRATAIARSLAASVTSTGSLVRSMLRSLLASLTATATATRARVYHKTLTALVNGTASFRRAVGKAISALLSALGIVSRIRLAPIITPPTGVQVQKAERVVHAERARREVSFTPAYRAVEIVETERVSEEVE